MALIIGVFPPKGTRQAIQVLLRVGLGGVLFGGYRCLGSDLIPMRKIEESVNHLPSISPDVEVASTLDKQEGYSNALDLGSVLSLPAVEEG